MNLPEQLAGAVAALRGGRAAEAVDGLRSVWSDPELAAANDLRDVRDRVGSLLAQALLESGHVPEADTVCRQVVRSLRQHGETEGLREVRALQDRIVRALAESDNVARGRAEAAKVAATPLELLLFTAATEEDHARVRVQKANALWVSEQRDEARALAHEGLERAEHAASVTWTVFARTLLAEIEADDDTVLAEAHLAAALHLAAGAKEFNLVSTVAQTAKQLGLALPLEAGPHAPEERA
jgi:hypothetical protein